MVAANQEVQSRLGNEFDFGWNNVKRYKCNQRRNGTENIEKVMDLGDDIKDYAIYQDIVDDNQLEN